MSSDRKLRIAIIGCGNMGTAIVRGLLRAQIFEEVIVFDPKGSLLTGVTIAESPVAALGRADIVLLSVKPYVLFDVLDEIREVVLKQKPTVLSIAAGVKLTQLENKLAADITLVRVMPNISCTVGSGVSAIFSPSVEGRELAEVIFQTVGTVIQAKSEADIDVFTALSAGGPAFLAEVVEGLSRGAEQMGLTRQQALQTAIATMHSTAELLLQSEEEPLIWRDRVATPGGTTERGLAVLAASDVVQVFANAVEASTKRARENLTGK